MGPFTCVPLLSTVNPWISCRYMSPGWKLLETITKRDLAQAVAKTTGTKQTAALEAVDHLFEAMRDTLIKGNRIEIRGLGAFTVKDTKPKPAARNPKTGEMIFVPARRKTHFKPGRVLKDALLEPVKAES